MLRTLLFDQFMQIFGNGETRPQKERKDNKVALAGLDTFAQAALHNRRGLAIQFFHWHFVRMQEADRFDHYARPRGHRLREATQPQRSLGTKRTIIDEKDGRWSHRQR